MPRMWRPWIFSAVLAASLASSAVGQTTDSLAVGLWVRASAAAEQHADWIPGLVQVEEQGRTTGFRLERDYDGGIRVTPDGEDASDNPEDGLAALQEMREATRFLNPFDGSGYPLRAHIEADSTTRVDFVQQVESASWMGTAWFERDGVLPGRIEARSSGGMQVQVTYAGSAAHWYPVRIDFLDGNRRRRILLDAYWRP